jgi:hypothetical protein
MSHQAVVTQIFHGKRHFYNAREPSWTPSLEEASTFDPERAAVVAAEIGGVVMLVLQRRTVDGQLGRENDGGRRT